jgi:DNA polymerase-1
MNLKEHFDWHEEPLYLIDGSSFLYRAFYAFPDLARSDGFPTNALYILLRVMHKLLRREKPRYACFFLDGRGPSFRQDLLPVYKAQRQRMPEGLEKQIDPAISGMELLGLPYLVGGPDAAEADDCIASLASRFKEERPVVIVGSDKDLKQCLDERVVLWDPGGKNERITALPDFRSEEGLDPEQWPDYLALVGDKSDNIAGVPGIGPKTARKLLQRFRSVKGLREHILELGPKERAKLEPHLEELDIYRSVTALRTDLDLEPSLEEYAVDRPDLDALERFLQEYEFKSLIPDFIHNGSQTEAAAAVRPARAGRRRAAERLPELRGKAVGLARKDEGLLLGLDHEEVHCRASLNDVFDRLAQAAEIFLPSYKALLEEHSEGERLPLEQCFDLGLAAYLLNPEERNYEWPRLLDTYLPEVGLHIDNEGLAALKIGELLKQRLKQAGLEALYHEVERPLIPVLVRMQQRGVQIDLEAFASFLREVEGQLDELSRSIFEQAGTRFNLRSPQQLAEVLFSAMGLKPGRKTPSGVPSTASPVLESLQQQHPVIKDILRFRSLDKLRSTYLAPLPKLVDREHRLHTRFNNLATATGRLSSSHPNLQNIPIRGELGPRMRSCFVAQKGCRLIAADYSQIELRILAHMSQDGHLLEAFTKGEDIHTRTAALLFDKPQPEISPDERRKAKTINFGLIYGMGPQKLARDLEIKLSQAKEFIEIYFSRLTGVNRFFAATADEAREQGFVTTLAGRRRLLPDINSRNENLAQQARRMAINTIIQGSAADLIKTAMVRVEHDAALSDLGARLILQIHDELLWEAPLETARDAGERAADLMAGVLPLSVPLTVDWGIGENWAKAH